MENGTSAGTACCVLCAATLGVGLGPAASAADNGALGTSSSASVQVRVSVAERGALEGLDSFAANSPRSAGDPLCLWLNTGTRGYTLTAVADGPPTHRLLFAADGQSLDLGAEPTPTLQAAARPGCPSGEEAQLTASRLSADPRGQAVTILVSPE